jgi:regulatory protein
VTASAYLTALQLLARRDLSSRELHDRLVRRGHDEAAVADALERLSRERALDDARVAEGRARTALARGRGRLRAVMEIEAAGIDRATARDATAAVFANTDEDALIARALARRLHGPIRDAAHFRRLHQALVRQGFPPDRITAALKARGGEPQN